MKPAAASLLIASLCAGSPAAADAITETIAFSGADLCCVTNVNGAYFDPQLGTLTGVTLTAAGTLAPDIFVGPAPTSTQATLKGLFDPLGTAPATILRGGTFTLTQSGNFLVGPPEAFSFSVAAPASSFSDYTAGPGYLTGVLEDLQIFSVPATAGAWGSYDPLSGFTGTLAVTYTYDVAEPASLALLLFAAPLVLLARKRQE